MASPSPSKLPSLRGILLARTHFEVLGLDTTSALAVRDLTDADVRAAYRRLALRCHPDKCPHEVNAQTAFVRVGQAFASLKTTAGRGEAWRRVLAGCGWLPAATVPGAAAARTVTPFETSVVALRAEGEALVAELRRWKEEWAEGVYYASNNNGGSGGNFHTSGGGGGGGNDDRGGSGVKTRRHVRLHPRGGISPPREARREPRGVGIYGSNRGELRRELVARLLRTLVRRRAVAPRGNQPDVGEHLASQLLVHFERLLRHDAHGGGESMETP
mmetsp:Transcript_29950/g.74966  ORF Transcript_29950/g.74966 Transcript_29950/m.74966 type:complete len:273 (-) Transcript_29950:811-1629(-)